jgi:anion transporter
MWKYGILAAAFAGILLAPAPEGLDPQAWTLFAVYAAAILGIMLRPQTEPVVMMVVISVSTFFVPIGTLLSGFANATVWMVFSAFLISQAFADTGLGQRVACHLVGRFGKTSLGLAYAAAITDLVISPATPSNTARTGGIVYPIFRSVSSALGSEPGETGKRFGSYLTLTIYQISLITAGLFVTACAPNILSVTFAKDIFGIDISWMDWMKAALLPGLIILAATPYIVYKIYPPEIKRNDDASTIAADRLRDLGPMSVKEKILVVFFILAIAGWATSSITKINSTAVALLFFSGCVVCRLLTWDTVLKNTGAWSTMVWYGGIIGISGALAKAGFFKWMAVVLQNNVDFTGLSPVMGLFAILMISLVFRYLFASMAAFVTTFVPVLMTIGLAANVPAFPLAMLLGLSGCFGALLTHYGGAVAPVLFGTGYVDQGTWWKVGAVIVIFNVLIYMTIGLPYWKMVGFW